MKRIMFALALYLFAVPLYAAEVINSGATNPIVPYGDYINFGSKIGSPGYGIRTNNGIVEFKNLSGNWATVGGSVAFSAVTGSATASQLPLISGLLGSATSAQIPTTITLDNITQITTRSHTSLSDIGTNAHTVIDSHIADTTDPHGSNLTQTFATIAGVTAPYLAQTNGTGTGITLAGTSTFPSGVWGSTGNVGIGSTSPLQKAYVAGNVQATGEFIEGTGSIASTASLIPYIQLSSTSNQIAATTPTLITYTNTDEQQTFSFTPTSGTVTIPENGVYCIIAVGQVGKVSGNANRYLDIWLRKNNADIARSGVRNTVREADDAKVVPVNVAMRCIAGDTITTYMATDNTVGSTGLYYYTPAGEADIPSIITTIYKISD